MFRCDPNSWILGDARFVDFINAGQVEGGNLIKYDLGNEMTTVNSIPVIVVMPLSAH